MKTVITQLAISYIIATLFFVPTQQVFAVEEYTFGTVMQTATFRFNNENWFTQVHPKFVSMIMHDDGSASGMTETGIPFVQYNVHNDVGIRVQRFEIQDHYHYIIEGEVAYSIENFSAQLAQAYEARTAGNTTTTS